MKRLYVAVFVALLGLAIGPPARAQSIDDIVKRGKLLVAIDTTNPPYGTVNDKMQPDGYEVALAGSMAKTLGVTLELVPVTTPNRIPFLVGGRADILLSTLTITGQRAMQVMYTSPYAALEFVVIAPKARAISSPADLKGLRVGVIRGGAADPMITKAAPEGATIVRFDDVAGTTQALTSGQVDAIAENWLVPAQLNSVRPGQDYTAKFTLARAHFGMGVRRGSFDLLHWINTYLYTIKTSGELAELHQRYLGVPSGDLPVF